MTSLRVACVQPTSTPDMDATVAQLVAAIGAARADGAEFVLLPETAPVMTGQKHSRELAVAEAEHPAVAALSRAAADNGVWLLIGSVAVAHGEGLLANRSLLVDGDGAIRARYDKIHMFDVDLAGGEHYRESETYRPGDAACIADTPWGPLGMTVCYDMRFPTLYRDLAHAGAGLISVPSAFTRPTGRAHWHVLLRARAIETGCFVLAPAQCGHHYGKRKTYGHSLIVDPWGEILAEAGDEPGVIAAELNLERIAEARAMIPSLDHDRPYRAPPTKSVPSAA